MIMKGRAPLRLPMVGLFCLAIVGAATLPAWATASQQPPPPPPPPQAIPAPVVQAAPTPPAPPAPPAPATRARAQATRQNPPPPPPVPKPAVRVERKVTAVPNWAVTTVRPANMPAEGLQLLDAYEKDREAIQKEIDQKLTARREAAVKALQDLQEQFTKAGKLDEAVVIRDYLRAGGPGANVRFSYRTIKR